MMKTILRYTAVLSVLTGLPALGQPHVKNQVLITAIRFLKPDAKSLAYIDRLDEDGQIRAVAALSRDPWREIDGITNKSSLQWIAFGGRVLQNSSEGMRIQGDYWCPTDPDVSYHGEFFIRHFPYKAAEDDRIGDDYYFLAVKAPLLSYDTVMGSERTIRSLEYGKVVEAPLPTKEELERQAALVKAERERQAKDKADAQARAFKFWMEQALNGDRDAEYHVGMKYLHGEGIGRNLQKAREWLAKAAAQGQKDAIDSIKNLPEE